MDIYIYPWICMCPLGPESNGYDIYFPFCTGPESNGMGKNTGHLPLWGISCGYLNSICIYYNFL